MTKKELKIKEGNDGGKDGLDEVEEDEEFELEGVLAIGRGRDFFLIVAPCQEAGVDARGEERKRRER